MFLGFDFDNTIANYELVFSETAKIQNDIPKNWYGSKKDLKQYLLSRNGGEKTWMSIQGKVYGEFMHKAELMDGFLEFLINCKSHEIPVFIVSHKTRFGHFDSEKISLRNEALKWMRKKKLFDKNLTTLDEKRVFFADTRKEKVKIISDLGCDYFIDDLQEVFQEPSFPPGTKKILLGDSSEADGSDLKTFKSWIEINSYLLGETDNKSLEKIVFAVTNKSPDSIKLIKGRGNSKVFKIEFGKDAFAMKIYPDKVYDNRPRLKTEFEALKLFQENSINNVPKPVFCNSDLNCGIYSWVDGKKIERITTRHIEKCVLFVRKLKALSDNNLKKINLASETCLSGQDLKRQIFKRLSKLQDLSNEIELGSFLKVSFVPLLERIMENYFEKWPASSKKKELCHSKMILSPSDFGLHNALENNNGKIIFLDFDYFGKDDPVKLAADFYFHPGMKISKTNKTYWLSELTKIFGKEDKDFEGRLNFALPMYGLRWILIILNEFLSDVQKRRKHAGLSGDFDLTTVKQTQLKKAQQLNDYLENNY